MKKPVLVTGASGFIGRALCSHLINGEMTVRGTLLPEESPEILTGLGVEPVRIEPVGQDTDWRLAVSGVETVVHLAARVHIMEDRSADPLAEFRRVNSDGTARLAAEAAKAGVKRFVFVSSIKVNGEESPLPYTVASLPEPLDPYGISKWEAEQAIRRIETETGLEVVVVRPTLVYGPGVKANFLNLLRLVSRGVPLPFGSITNRRSLIYVANLADAIAICAQHPRAAGRTFLVSDGEDVSTPELVRRTAAALGVPGRLFPFPVCAMSVLGRILGKSRAVKRLTGSLAVDSSEIKNELGWQPPFSMEEGLLETAHWFRTLSGK